MYQLVVKTFEEESDTSFGKIDSIANEIEKLTIAILKKDLLGRGQF